MSSRKVSCVLTIGGRRAGLRKKRIPGNTQHATISFDEIYDLEAEEVYSCIKRTEGCVQQQRSYCLLCGGSRLGLRRIGTGATHDIAKKKGVAGHQKGAVRSHGLHTLTGRSTAAGITAIVRRTFVEQ